MKLLGCEFVRFKAENRDGEWKVAISYLDLDEFINSFILNRMVIELKKGLNNSKLSTEYITIDGLEIPKGTKVKLRFKVTLKETIPILEHLEYETISEIDIIEFYNHIVNLFDGYAYELDTQIDNIKVELKELEILEN